MTLPPRIGLFAALSFLLGLSALPAPAQKPPTDLTELDLEQILSLRINRERDQERWSLFYRFVHVKFDGYRDGTRDLSTEEVIFRPGEVRTQKNFPVVPQIITQQAHSLEVSYHATPRLSFGLLLPYIRQETDHISSVVNFSRFVISSSGLGDIALSASYLAWHEGPHNLMFSVAVNLPTGSIDEIGPTPRVPGTDTQLPYTMQLGSGTFDLTPSLSYAGRSGLLRWGGKLSRTLRLGENDRDYTLGNRLRLSAWLGARPTPWLQPHLKVLVQFSGRIQGGDEDLKVPNPQFPYPAAVTNPALFGGEEVDGLLGLKLSAPEQGFLQGLALEIEGGIPLYQSLNGPQPKETWRLDLGCNWGF